MRAFLADPVYRPDPKGDPAARKAVAAFYAERGLKIPAENIVLTSGTSESYFYLFKLLAGTGAGPAGHHDAGKILFPNPSYPLFEEIARISGTEFLYYKLDEAAGWQIDFASLEAKISATSPGSTPVSAIVLISPSNPTGAVLSAATLKKVIALARKHKLPIISDEVFSEFIFDGKKFPRIAKMAKDITVFTLNGISKTYALPGLKLSWIAVTGPKSKEYLEELERFADALLSTNQITQKMLPQIMRRGKKFLAGFRRKVEGSRNLAAKILGAPAQKHGGTAKNPGSPSLEFHLPEGGFYLFLKIKGARVKSGPAKGRLLTDEDLVIDLLKKNAIFAHPGYFYDYDKEVFLLVSLLLPPEKLKTSLRQIIKLVSHA